MYLKFYKTMENIGEATRFTWRYFFEAVTATHRSGEFTRQCFFVGYKSLALVLITALIMGLVVTIQSRPVQTELSGAGWIPRVMIVSLVREIVPVITALVCTGKIGSVMAAEFAAMKVTGRITDLEKSGIDIYRKFVVPRVTATFLMLPLLCILATGVSLYGAFLGTNVHGIVSWKYYWNQVFEILTYSDIIPPLIRSAFFGFGIALIGCYKGMYSKPGTSGVGIAVSGAVVLGSVYVFIVDLLAAQVINL
jgi:phospholipid/cholesterol/gamma-HCH transport system permease protein